jgi:hypothetical protein
MDIKRDSNGRIVAGSGSLNAGGRPSGLSRRIRELVGESPEEMIQIAISFAKGEIPGQSPKDRLEALKLIFDRGWGRSPETIVTANLNEVSENNPIAQLSRSQLEALATMAIDEQRQAN